MDLTQLSKKQLNLALERAKQEMDVLAIAELTEEAARRLETSLIRNVFHTSHHNVGG